jgi:hypothetical protein
MRRAAAPRPAAPRPSERRALLPCLPLMP